MANPSKTMNKTNSSLKIGSPSIRVPLASKPAKSSMIVRTGPKKNPTLTNAASKMRMIKGGRKK
jgi:hypothetical protein